MTNIDTRVKAINTKIEAIKPAYTALCQSMVEIHADIVKLSQDIMKTDVSNDERRQLFEVLGELTLATEKLKNPWNDNAQTSS